MTGIKPTRSHDEGALCVCVCVEKALMVHDAEVARYDFVFQHGAGWNINPISVVGNDDDGALRGGRAMSLVYVCQSQKRRRELIKAINQ